MNFPIDLINPDDRILCLFASGFGGENDVMHLYRKGCYDVTIVDNDGLTLQLLADCTGYMSVEMDIVRGYYSIDKNYFNVIISDQFSNLHRWCNDVLVEYFRRGGAKLLIIGAGINELSRHPDDNYIKRSDHNGGQYWRIINLNKQI